MGHSLFLNSTFDKGINKQQGHATLAFLKIDMLHGDPLSRAPGAGGRGEIKQCSVRVSAFTLEGNKEGRWEREWEMRRKDL